MERLIDRTYLDEMIHAICRDNLAKYFPELAGGQHVDDP